MSHYNYIPKVTINETEYKKLKKEAKEKQKLKDRLKNRERDIANLNSKMNKRIKEVEKTMNKRVSKLNDLNNRLSSELRTLNIEFNNERKRNEEKVRKLNSKLSNMKSELNLRITSLDKKVDAIEEEIYQEINEVRKETQEALNIQKKEFNSKIKSVIDSIQAKEDSEKNLALNWLKDLNTIVEMIEVLDHEKYKPNQLNKLKSQIELAKNNIENGVYQSAISSLQERYISAGELFNEVNYLQKEFEELQTMAKNYVDELKVLLDTQKNVEMEIREQDVEVDVDKWSNKGITKLEQEINSLSEKIEDNSTSIEEMYEIISRIKDMFKEAKELPEKAKENIILSELRLDMAEQIEESLEEAGFELVDDVFERDDARKSLILKFHNSSDEEIITIVKAEKNFTNSLNVMFESVENERYKKHRLDKIINKLQSKGLEVGNFKCTDSTTRSDFYDEVRDFEKIKKEGLPSEN